MAKYADYIQQIEIDSLWSGKHHIVWNLSRQVNILSGVNGMGKSTILNKVVKGLSAGGEFPSHMLKGVRLKVQPEDARWIRFDIIRSFDAPLLNLEAVARMDRSLAISFHYAPGGNLARMSLVPCLEGGVVVLPALAFREFHDPGPNQRAAWSVEG